jgi:SAM-dependent methyltransferase
VHVLRGAPCTLHRALGTLHPALSTLHPALSTLHAAVAPLHPALCTLHSALCALHLLKEPRGRRRGAIRIDDAVLRAAALSAPRESRDEMAGPSYLHPNPLVRWLFWKRLDVVAGFLSAHGVRHASGLDFGCGIGVQLPTLSATTDLVYATDLVMAPGRYVASRLGLRNVAFVEPNRLSSLPPLDYVVSTDVLEHVRDLEATVRRFGEALRPGGMLVVSGPTENAFYRIGRTVAGFGRTGKYHQTDITGVHDAVARDRAGFRVVAHRVLPLPRVVEAFHIYAYTRP